MKDQIIEQIPHNPIDNLKFNVHSSNLDNGCWTKYLNETQSLYRYLDRLFLLNPNINKQISKLN